MRIEATFNKKDKGCRQYWRLLWEVVNNGTGDKHIKATEDNGKITFDLQADNMEQLMETVLSS